MQHMEMARQHNAAENDDEDAAANGNEAIKSVFPETLRRRYEVFLTLPAGEKLMAMRSVTSHHLGSLVKMKVRLPAQPRVEKQLYLPRRGFPWHLTSRTQWRILQACVQGVVTHCTDVKPQVAVATYLDITSGIEMFQEVVGPLFTPIDKGHKDVNPLGEPTLQMRGSKLIKFQQIKIQEMADEVPSSATPRCADTI
jgi:hypothetical protein